MYIELHQGLTINIQFVPGSFQETLLSQKGLLEILEFQKTDVIQITNDSLSYDNPSMPLQPMNFPHGIPSFFLSEIREGRSINIVMLTYDNLTDSFSSPIFITDNQFINRNAVSSEPAWGRDGLIIWESNKSGNFDLYYNLPFQVLNYQHQVSNHLLLFDLK